MRPKTINRVCVSVCTLHCCDKGVFTVLADGGRVAGEDGDGCTGS